MWDAAADGYTRGEGVASIVLKTLSQALADGDTIECIIRETGVNQDGRTAGLTMPNNTQAPDNPDHTDLGTRYFSVAQPNILGVFTGQGAQWPRMGAHLIETSVWAQERISQLDSVLQSLPKEDRPKWSIKALLLAGPETSRVTDAAVSQPLCLAVQIVLVDILRTAGIRFKAVVGHSSGEIGAAYAAGFLTDENAIRGLLPRHTHQACMLP
ncbi:putative PKS/NRPS-like protein biosynthetic cluster [Arthroderma sp. PD_2]|nr:putative PKS/NRPS-like protein biosynthetic cluster [Arthroderma sp. PD_2]